MLRRVLFLAAVAVVGTAILVPAMGNAAPKRRCPGVDGTLVGTPNSDRLCGSNDSQVINALAGDDRLLGRGGDDKLNGMDGNDTIVPGVGADEVKAGAGDDDIYAWENDGEVDEIRCGDGDDFVMAEDIDIVDVDCETVTTA